MLIAHLPAGYLLTRRLTPRLAGEAGELRWLMGLGLVGAVLPDFDLLYFYLVDGRRTLHHDYWTHIPAFWLAAFALSTALFGLARVSIPWPAVAVLSANIFLHLALDTPVGGIAWLYPYDPALIRLSEVPARFDWWVWSFVFHWSFLIELAIVALAARRAGLIGLLRRRASTHMVRSRAARRSPTE